MTDTPLDLDAIEAQINAAHDEVSRLCLGPDAGRWRMSIPAREDRDSDLVISLALRQADALVAALRKAEAQVAAVLALADGAESYDRTGWPADIRAAVDGAS